MNIPQFISKWRKSDLTERSAAQQHFLDLCELFDHPKPADVDPKGEWFTFEKGATKHGGGDGWADVWKKGFFGWEYKGKHKDLDAAYEQLLKYRESLENPPLLVVCDMDRIVVHTNFTNAPVEVHDIPLEKLGEPRNLQTIRAVFHDPETLRPGTTSQTITAEAAERLAAVAQTMRDRGLPPAKVAHMLDRVIFCLFAEDVALLPEGLFSRLVAKSKDDPIRFARLLGQLFEAMAHGGDFGADTIRHFNGNLFDDVTVLELTEDEIESIHHAAALDWSAVDPSIFGTLFERGLDPDKRSQLGAHYTSREDIETLVEPVVMQPLRREWDELRDTVERLLATGRKKPRGADARGTAARSTAARSTGFQPVIDHGQDGRATDGRATDGGSDGAAGTAKKLTPAQKRKARREAERMIAQFLHRLQSVKVLDPACGSGNFLYVTLQKLLDFEKQVGLYAMDRLAVGFLPRVRPEQLYGIEINPYAFELAQMVVWIGYLQWRRQNGFMAYAEPILTPMDNFQCKDAILDLTDPDNPREPDWPAVDFIVSNPPFLGGGMLRQNLGDDYVGRLFAHYGEHLPNFSDLCCYWFEKARAHIQAGKCERAGLLATQAIRGGASREVLKRIKETGDIFFAESDRPWILDGANVHVSMVGFDDGEEPQITLDGAAVATVNPDLSTHSDVTQALSLPANRNTCFMGPSPKASFDIDESAAMRMLTAGGNVHGRPNSDVIRRVQSGVDITRSDRGKWTIDFALMSETEASQYQEPFEYAKRVVYPVRSKNRRKAYAIKWWQYAEARPGLRAALGKLDRHVTTPEVAKHRVYVWRRAEHLCNQQTLVFARSDDYFFGVLHSRLHEVWARALGTQLRERESGFRYTPTTCFETFPLPEPTPEQEQAIGGAAKELDALRNNWLNPPEWTREEVLEFPGSTDGPWERYVHDPDGRGIGTVHYPRIVPKDAECEKQLKKRTLTNLYNERPTWLDIAHRALDEAVFAAYGWEPGMSDDDILAALLDLNLARAEAEAR
ncbi:MAG: DNA methyltransferase [Planctomycetota bacterium]